MEEYDEMPKNNSLIEDAIPFILLMMIVFIFFMIGAVFGVKFSDNLQSNKPIIPHKQLIINDSNKVDTVYIYVRK